MGLHLVLLVCLAYTVHSVTVNSVQIRDNVVPVKGSSIQLVCSITGFTSSTVVEWFITDTQDIPKSGPGSSPYAQCKPDNCFVLIRGYTFTSDGSHVYVNITGLSQSKNGKWWTCKYSNSKQALNLEVYTVPTSIQYDRVPDGSQDLSVTGVKMECRTNCVYPELALIWFYVTGSASQYQYTPSGVTSSSVNTSCNDPERDYKSTLTLTRNTTFTNNSDTTVRFRCGITSFPGMLTVLYTPVSPNISFAVKVTSVVLKEENTELTSDSILNITSGKPTTQTCLPGISRPHSTVVWFIGSQERQRSVNTNYTFTPSDKDHGKMIYCKVFNIQPEINGVQSEKPKLYVKVQVSRVNMYVDNITVTTTGTVNVTNGEVQMLECKTGTSRPPSTIVWYIGDNQVSEGSRFIFTAQTDDHGKLIYCKAYNMQPKNEAISSINSTLYVKVPTTRPTLANKTISGSVIVLSGDVTRLVCITSATRPAAIVTWTKGETILPYIENTFTITLSNLTTVTSIVTFTPDKSDNENVITCMTGITGQRDSPNVQHGLNVWWGPSNATVMLSSPFPWREDQTDKYLLCKASNGDNGNPASTVNWTSAYGTSDKTNRRLVFPVLSAIHNTMAATCELSNAYTRLKGVQIKSKTTQIIVQYGPDSANISERLSLTVTEGKQHTNITCTSDCYPNCISSWISITGGSADISADVLSLSQVTRNQTGKYTCTTSNTAPGYQRTANATIDITVHYAPDITAVVFPNTEFVENNTAVLRCNATGVPNIYNYIALTQTWGNTTIPNPRPPISTTPFYSSLSFDALRLEDTGTYTCVINNGVRDIGGILNQANNIEIFVKVRPKLFHQELTFTGALAGFVKINVPFYSFPPVSGINFTRQDDAQINKSSKITVSYEISPIMTKFYGEDVTLNGSIAYLQITDIRETDFTNYTLEVTNSIGNTQTVIQLISQSAPSMPQKFNRTNVGETNVVVSWETGFHGGNNQTFVIQLSKDKYLWYNRTRVFGGMNATGLPMNATLEKLSEGTQYYVRMYSYNKIGTSSYADILNFTTNGDVTIAEGFIGIGPIIGGGVGIVISLAVIGAVIAKFIRNKGQFRAKKKGGMYISSSDREHLKAEPRKYENIGLHNCYEEDDDDPEDIDNLNVGNHDPVYGNMLPVKPISVNQLRGVCRHATNDPSTLYKEFKTIPVKYQLDTHEAAKPENKAKIRYREIYTYDKNRVTLPLQPGNYSSDFINASYIRGYKKDNMYIASQGAMKDTVEDVWRMVWKHRIMTIVMLTNCNEDNREKCFQYWPSTEEEVYGKFHIKSVSEEVYSEFTIRTFTCKMSGSGSQIEVTQYHFTAWPDKDVPDTCLSLVQLWKMVKNSKQAGVVPWMVHCSAGVGRTGTFIALDYLYDQGKDEGSFNIHTCVSELRDQRLHMVQTSAQYVFLHQAALEVLNPIATVCKSEEYRDMWRNLQTKTPGCNETKLQTEYKEITIDDSNAMKDESGDDTMFATNVTRDKFSDSKMPENQTKTRNRNILPPDAYRPMLITDGTDDFINAAVLSTYKKSDSLIITQVPLKETLVEFVRMVRDYEVSTIVLMDDDIPQLQSRDVNQFHFTSWHGEVPEIKGHVLSLLTDVDKSVTDTVDQGPLVVQCMDGASKSGLFCVMLSVLERLKCEREVAIAESIRFIKARRRQIISNFEQYKFCYEFVLVYLDSCSEYANVI